MTTRTTGKTTLKAAAPAKAPSAKAKSSASSAGKSTRKAPLKSQPAAAVKTPAKPGAKTARPKPAAKAVKAPARKPAAKKAAATKAARPAAKPKAAVKPKTRRAPSKTSPRAVKTAAPARTKTSRAPKPLASEVSYSGKVFRSRLEARWAILMDLLEINWDYEPCHYQVGPELYYLPDFYLPEHRLWLEVKGPAFLDAQSMAKCLGSVAGPMPLPLREPPYTAADRLLLAGPFSKQQAGRPVHTLITKSSAGAASLSRSVLDASGVSMLDVWDTAEADGVSKPRRPSPARVAALLEPDPVRMPVDDFTAAAYRFAATARFDDVHRRLAHGNDWTMAHRLERRRAGRPLGPFPAAEVTPAEAAAA